MAIQYHPIALLLQLRFYLRSYKIIESLRDWIKKLLQYGDDTTLSIAPRIIPSESVLVGEERGAYEHPHDTFLKSHFWNPEVLNFTNFFVPRANSCPMGWLFGHLGSHIEFPLDSKNRGKIGVGVTILIITSVILVYFQQMRYQSLKYSIPKILRPVTF